MRKHKDFFNALLVGLLTAIFSFTGIYAADQLQIQHGYSDNVDTGRTWVQLERDLDHHGGVRLDGKSFLRTEDLTTYTEVDAGADITVAADTITFTDLSRNVESYVYKDFGTDYWSGDFEHRFKVNYSASAASGLVQVWGMANSVESIENITQHISIWLYAGRFYIRERDVSWDAGTSLISGIATDTDYYLKIVRDDSEGTYGTLYLYVYSDLNFSTLIGSTSLALRVKLDFRYIYALSTYNDSNAATVSGTVSYLQLDTANYFDGNLVVKANGGEARFEPDGYLDEPESTNLLKSSRLLDVDDANWTGSDMTGSDCVQDETGIDGAANTAWTLTDDGAAAYESISTVVSKSADDDSDYTASICVKKTTAATVYSLFRLGFTGGTTEYNDVIIDTNNGVLYDHTGAVADSKQIEDYGNWWRVSITDSDDAADNANIVYQVFPTGANALDGGIDDVAVGSNVFDWAQLENRSTATSPIYTTSTAVTRPADSFSLTMSDAFKEKFAEALGSELAPDFGAVLGPELITDENDRTFSDGDVGNWTLVESGSAASLDYDSTSIGGHDDKQIKLTAEAGEDYVLARLTSSNISGISAGYYILSAKVYIDPNADQDNIRVYASSFTGSTKIQSLYGAGSDYSTVNKGVWENVYSIFELVSGDLVGIFYIGFFDTGNLTANDICYIDDISLRKITFSDDWTAGDGWGPKFALTAPSLGDEELSNGDFSSVTEGSDLFDSGVGDYRDNTGNWSEYGTNTVANDSDALKVTYSNNADGAYLMLRDAEDLSADLTNGHQYRIEGSIKVGSGDDVTIYVWDGSAFTGQQSTSTSFEPFQLDFICKDNTNVFLNFSSSMGAGEEVWVRDFTIKEITLDGHDTPTVDADDYLEYDTDNDRVRLVATDGNAKLSQTAVTVGTLYYYEIDIETVTSGRIKLVNTDCETYDKPINDTNTVVKMFTSGVHSGVFRAGNTVVGIWRDAFSTDITINSWSIKPYTPSHANTDPRFDRQTEGSDVLGGDGDCATDFVDVKSTGWSHDAGNEEYDCDGSQTGASYLRANSILTDAVRYKITFTVANYSAGEVYVRAGGNLGTTYSANGTYTDYLTCVDNTNFYIWCDADFIGSVDDITVIPVTLSDYSGTNWYPYDEDGGAVHVAGSGSNLYQSIGSIGTYYLYIYKVSSVTAGSCKPIDGTFVSSSGVYSEIVKCTSTTSLGIYGSTTFDGTIDYLYIIPLSTPVAHCTGSQSAKSWLLTGDGVLAPSADHKIVFTIDNRTNGEIGRMRLGVNNGISVTADSDDDWPFYATDAGDDESFGIRASDNFVGDITALSVKEVTRHAKGTMLMALTPGYSYSDIGENRQIIQLRDVAYASGVLYEDTNGFFRTYCGSGGYASSADVDYATNTTYLIAAQWGDTISNVNYYRAGAVAIASPWTSGAWGSDVEFDGAYSLGDNLNLFYSKFGSNNLRELRFYDRILDDRQIEVIRRSIQ
jgi:hypothetical protein